MGVYGNNKYDDSHSNDHTDLDVWICSGRIFWDDPRNAITFAGVLLLIAALATLYIKTDRVE